MKRETLLGNFGKFVQITTQDTTQELFLSANGDFLKLSRGKKIFN